MRADGAGLIELERAAVPDARERRRGHLLALRVGGAAVHSATAPCRGCRDDGRGSRDPPRLGSLSAIRSMTDGLGDTKAGCARPSCPRHVPREPRPIDRVILPHMPAVVLVLPKSGYRNQDFISAAAKLGVEVIVASDVCHQLADVWEETPVALRFRDAESAAGELAKEVAQRRPVAVIGVDDLTALVAAMAAET